MRWGAPPPRGGGWGGGGGGYSIIGFFVPKPIVWLGAAILIASVSSAVLQGFGIPAFQYTMLIPASVWHGELWRLLTWSLIAPDPFGIVFGLLALFFFGPSLMSVWGKTRFFRLYFGGAALIGALTSAVMMLLVPRYGKLAESGVYAMLTPMLIAWGTLFPDRTILLMFVLPVRGRYLLSITVFMLFLMAVFSSFWLILPSVIALVVTLLYMDVLSFRRVYLRARMAMLQRDYKRRTGNLRVVDREKADEPPRWTH
jgi:membrane associated rhomboid family serine protease